MNFYKDAAIRVKLVINKLNSFEAPNCELVRHFQDFHEWLKDLHREWASLEKRMREKKCGMPKLKSEDDRQFEIENCLALAESENFDGALEGFEKAIL